MAALDGLNYISSALRSLLRLHPLREIYPLLRKYARKPVQVCLGCNRKAMHDMLHELVGEEGCE